MSNSGRAKFNPAGFGRQIIQQESDEGDESAVFKGGDVIKIDLEKLDKTISNLRKNHTKQISTLSGSLKVEFERVVTYVSLLHDSSCYSQLHDIVIKYFSDLTDISPGTIGAYLAGCIIGKEYNGSKRCSHVCAGSAPLPLGSDGWTSCGRPIVWANYYGSGYDFVYLSTKDDMSHVIMYVGYHTYSKCPGFSEEEKNHLKSKGIKYIELVSYSSATYKVLNKEISVDDLKHRHEHHEEEDDNTFMYAVLFVIIIIVILWICLSRKR